MDKSISELVDEMTLEEKAGLCSGENFWLTKAVDRLGIPSIMMADGPHGLRKQEADPDHIALSESVPATCFPTAAALACSWDRDLVGRVGSLLGKECQALGVDIILGPGTNIKRSPLCGRNFEYFSEDPFLSSRMASSHVSGVQGEGVGTSLKHFAANNQEYRRLLTDTVIDERTLREIYLASFEPVVRNTQPWTVMCAYNKLNGEFCSEHSRLLSDILRDEWGFEGFVVSDWGAVNERVDALAAGLELEMPACRGDRDKLIVRAVQTGQLDEALLDRAVMRILRIVEKAVSNRKKGASFNRELHHKSARETAADCMVLLKNEDNILPLEDQKTLAVIGGFAAYPRFQGGGSSHVNPSILDIPLDEIRRTAEASGMTVLYEPGYPVDMIRDRYSNRKFESASDIPDTAMIEAACRAAEKADSAVVFAGLPEPYESEGYDRKHISIPPGHLELIRAVAEVQPQTVVVLSNGSPVEMPWLDGVKAVVEAYLGGQGFGGAVSDVLFGRVNPSGKLAETFPRRVQDNPSYLNFPGDRDRVEYREGIFVGYRYYDSAEVEPLFPFGYGLSYTDFSYDSLEADSGELTGEGELTLTVKVRNTGEREGKETVQLYIRPVDSPVSRPLQELKGFEKIKLNPDEEGTLVFHLSKRDFAYYDTGRSDWYAPDGTYEICIGSSSRDIRLKRSVELKSLNSEKTVYTRNSTVFDLSLHPEGKKMLDIAGRKMEEERAISMDLLMTLFKDMPLRSFHMFAGDLINEEKLNSLLETLNKD